MKNSKIYFIDIVYYNCYAFYRRYEKDLNEFSGQLITALCISLNIIAIIIFTQEFYNITIFENKWNTLYLSVPIGLFIIFWYNKIKSIEDIETAMLSNNKASVNRLNLLARGYIIASIFGFLVIAIYIGELNNPPPFWENWFK